MSHRRLNILLLEPFFSGSHKQWAEGLKRHSRHSIALSTLPGRHWKWRMHGAAVTFAERHKKDINDYDLIITTDMCDVATMKGILDIKIPVLLYFHENQLEYPWSKTDDDIRKNWDRRYMWINFTSAMAADRIWFNSAYNRDSFLEGLLTLLKPFPDYNRFGIEDLTDKSKVMHLGIELAELLCYDTKENEIPVILWNHRWEYDKRPEMFFNTLFQLQESEIDFKLVALGTNTGKYPIVFDEAKVILEDKIVHFGSVESKDEYIELVKQCDILPVTSIQDFFGISAVEAIAGGVVPLLPRSLAFEEHIPQELYQDLFYNSDEEFFLKLNNLLASFRKFSLQHHVERYDWKEMIKKYDEGLEEILGTQ